VQVWPSGPLKRPSRVVSACSAWHLRDNLNEKVCTFLAGKLRACHWANVWTPAAEVTLVRHCMHCELFKH
jgi:hypothetical protein